MRACVRAWQRRMGASSWSDWWLVLVGIDFGIMGEVKTTIETSDSRSKRA